MHGLWTPIFTLLGVLVGGFFTYLGLKAQLKQQKELNSMEWRRKVKSEPLKELRKELAVMATKQSYCLAYAKRIHYNKDIGEQERRQLESDGKHALNDLKGHMKIGTFEIASYLQDDKEISEKIHLLTGEIVFLDNVFTHTDLTQFEKLEVMSTKFENSVREIQTLINKRLVEL